MTAKIRHLLMSLRSHLSSQTRTKTLAPRTVLYMHFRTVPPVSDWLYRMQHKPRLVTHTAEMDERLEKDVGKGPVNKLDPNFLRAGKYMRSNR